MKRLKKITLIAFISAIFLLVMSAIPTWRLERPGMTQMSGDKVTIYYEREAEAGQEVFQLAEAEAQKLMDCLDIEETPELSIYIYDDKSVLQTKKYDYITQLIPDQMIDFYIGDNIGTNVIITSPANPGLHHDKDTILAAVKHEMIHAYTSVINEDLPLFIDEGLACYLADMMPDFPIAETMEIPSVEDIQVSGLFAPLIFANDGGYYFAPTLIEYLLEEYSRHKLIAFIYSGNVHKSYGVSLDTLHAAWVDWLGNHHVYEG